MEYFIDIGGRPGYDCNGFCKFCYFKNVKTPIVFGCKYCLPFKKGCDYCTNGIIEHNTFGFKPLNYIISELEFKMKLQESNNIEFFNITGGGDISCYPYLHDLISFLSEFNIPIKIGYTSGKGFKLNDINFLINNNIYEVNYSLFSSSYRLRSEYLNDKNPQESLKIFHDISSYLNVYASIVLIKGVNDGIYLENTLDFIEKSNCKNLLLLRFGNTIENGLILKNGPILNGISSYSIDEFKNIIYELSGKRKNIRISGTPIGDPNNGSPFAILKHENYIKKLPIIKKKATIITGSVAYPYLNELFVKIGNNNINVIPLKKEIACLITEDDLKDINLKNVKNTVIIPGRCLIHDKSAKSFFSSDGNDRLVRRGPDILTVDGEISISMNLDQILDLEYKQFSELIIQINSIGVD